MWGSLPGSDRAVRTDTREGRTVRVVVLERSYDAPRAEVWAAVTSGDRLSRWLGPVSGDLRLGGRYQVEGNAGGEVLRCEEPALLEVTWEFGGAVSWVLVTLAEDDGGTRLRLEHAAEPDDTWGRFGPGAVGLGWELGLGGLAMNLADPGQPSGEPDYRLPAYAAFVRRAGAAWGEADAASGADVDEARAAAGRCVAAYTQLPPEDEAAAER